MLYARALKITWAEDQNYWKWVPQKDARCTSLYIYLYQELLKVFYFILFLFLNNLVNFESSIQIENIKPLHRKNCAQRHPQIDNINYFLLFFCFSIQHRQFIPVGQ